MIPQKLTPTQTQAKDISRNIAVTAGAGSGKTEVLTQRLIHIFEKNRHLKIHNVLVLTFTEKSAAEMKERFRLSLKQRTARSEPTGKERNYWEGLQENFEENRISTVHAFCAFVLRHYPIESDIDPGFGILEGFDMQNLLQDSVKTVLRRKAGDPANKDLERLLPIWRRSRLIDILLGLIEKRWEIREWIDRYKTREPDRLMEEIVAHRDACLEELLKNRELHDLQRRFGNYEKDTPEAKEDSFGRAKNEYSRLLNSLLQSPPLPSDQALEIIRCLSKIRKPGKITKAWSRDGAALKESIDQLTALLAGYPLADFSRRREKEGIRVLKSLAVLLAECLEEYHRLKRENQCLDFEDLQIETDSLMRRHPVVRRELAARFRFIMVDEFQDTNDLQWNIIRQLAMDDSGKLPADKLFIVGDEKQSIYSFRGADVTTFGRAREELIQANGVKAAQPCTGFSGDNSSKTGEIVFQENFRSTPGLIQFTNAFFHRLLSRTEGYEPYEAPPQPLRSCRNTTGGSVELLLVNKSDDSSACYREEARLIAGRIHLVTTGCLTQYRNITHLIQQNKAAIAILFRRRTHLKVYEEAFKEAGLDFTVQGGRGFFQRQEIKDFSNILDFLVNPRNSIALSGILRSPLMGISDDALFTISRSAGNNFWEKVLGFSPAKSLESADEEAFYRARESLNSWLWLRDRVSISELIRTILDESGYLVMLFKDPQISPNVEKLIAMARKFERTPWRGLKGFAAFWDEHIMLEEKEGGGEDTAEKAIQLMSIHKSKGLEFPMVIIPDLADNFFAQPPSSYCQGRISWSNSNLPSTMEMGIKVPDPEKKFKLNDTFLRSILFTESRKKAMAERKRLLYVAATRAEDHLILAGQIRFPSETGRDLNKTLDDCKNFMEWVQMILGIESLERESLRLSYQEETATVSVITPFTEEQRFTAKPCSQKETSHITQKEYLQPEQDILRNLASVEKTGPIRLSPTAISCYASCPRHYYLRYVLGTPVFSSLSIEGKNAAVDSLAEKSDNISLSAAFRGLVAHSLFEDGIFDDRDVLRRRLLSCMRSLRHSIPENDHAVNNICDEIYVNLQNFYNSDTFIDSSKEFYNEIPFEVELENARIFGIIDKLYRSPADGLLRVLDFKTNAVSNLAHASAEVKKHRYDFQVQCYCLAAEVITGEKVEEARLFFSHIPGEEREIVIPFQADDKRALLSRLYSLSGYIEKGIFSPLFSQACGICAYNFCCKDQNPNNSGPG